MLDESTVNLRIHLMHVDPDETEYPPLFPLCSSCRLVSSFFHFGMVLMIGSAINCS